MVAPSTVRYTVNQLQITAPSADFREEKNMTNQPANQREEWSKTFKQYEYYIDLIDNWSKNHYGRQNLDISRKAWEELVDIFKQIETQANKQTIKKEIQELIAEMEEN